MLQQEGVKLRDVGYKVQGGHQGDVKCVEADDGQTLNNIPQLIHQLLIDVPLLCPILPYEEKLAQCSQQFFWQLFQLRSNFFATT